MTISEPSRVSLCARGRELLADLMDCRDHEVTVDTRARPGSQVVGRYMGAQAGMDSAYGSDAGAWLSLVAHGLLERSAPGRLRLIPLGVETAKSWSTR